MIANRNSLTNSALLSKYTIILSLIPALFTAVFPGRIVVITIICAYPLIFFGVFSQRDYLKNFDASFYIKLFQIFNLFILLRGFFDAKSSEDWRVLLSSTVPLYLFIFFSFFLAKNKELISTVFSTFLSYGLIICFIIFIIPFSYNFGFPKAISPIYILILTVPYVNKKYSIFIIFLAVISFFSDLESRSNLINIVVSFLIVFTFLFKNLKAMLWVVKTFRILILVSPIIFLILGISGIFNIFLVGEYFSSNDQSIDEALIDSRTGIYIDVFHQLAEDDAIFMGLGASGKTETYLADILSMDLSKIYKEGRRGTESGMLNFIQWGGAIGGFLYYMLFIKSSYYGIYKSKNWFCIMLGLWLCFKGFYSFVEDRLTFSINSIFIFFAIGICLNRKIREMTDQEMRYIFQYILRKTRILSFLASKYRRY